MLLELKTNLRLINKTHRTIRSDEFLTQQGWVTTETHHNFPALDHILCCGVKITAMNHFPSWNLSSLFGAVARGPSGLRVNFGFARERWLPRLARSEGWLVLSAAISSGQPTRDGIIG